MSAIARSGPAPVFVLKRVLAAIAAGLALGLAAAPAHAQLSGSLSVDSQDRFRGYALGQGRPVATLDLSFDHPSGFYANASVTEVDSVHDDLRLLATQGSLGYAQRLTGNLSVDGGVTRTQYEVGPQTDVSVHYTEIYAGATTNRSAFHLFYSPDYLRPGVSTLYGDASVLAATIKDVKISAHVGVLQVLSGPSTSKTRYDWRLGAARQVRSVELHAAVTGGGPGREYYQGQSRSFTAFTFGFTWFH